MIPIEAYKIAIKGGWKMPEGYGDLDNIYGDWGLYEDYNQYISHEETAFDPTFWQCLGKTLG